MPATPTTFASAAAFNGTGDASSGKTSGGSGDWTRPRMNGSQTFRRPSQLNTNTTSIGQQREPSSAVQTPSSGVYVPPHMNAGFGRGVAGADNRYNKEQMLDIFKAQSESSHRGSVADLLTEGWTPGQSTAAGHTGWGRRDEGKDQNHGPDVCWDETGATQPLGLIAMTDEEKELFSNSVNSTMKPPQPKEGVPPTGINGRKPSISQGTGSLSSRPGTRRRDTSDSFTGNPLASPTFVRGAGRDENPLASPPPSLLRRRTDIKEGSSALEKPKLDTSGDTISPFSSLRRTTTNPLSAGVTGPSSPWATEPQSAGGFGRMGSFGVLDQPGNTTDKKPGFGSLRGESRFLKDLRGKDSSEDISKGRDKSAPFGMDKVAEEGNFPGSKQPAIGSRGEPGVIGEDPEARVGSAALGGDDASPPQASFLPGMDPQRRHDDIPSDLPPFRERMQQQREGQGLSGSFNEPMSPTDTNPYHSPDHERASIGRSREDDEESFQGTAQQKLATFDVSDHGSRPSSTAPPRNLSGLGGFGSLGSAWSAVPGPMGAPGRSPLNDPFFGSLSEIGSPGGAGAFGPPSMSGQGNLGGTRSKLGSLFPQSMQDQMRANEQRQDFFGSVNSSNAPPRDTDSPAARSSRNILDDIFGTQDRNKGIPPAHSPFSGNEGPFSQPPPHMQNAPPFSTAIGTPGLQAQSHQGPGSFFSHPSESEQDHLPPAQQRTMVMPDRMRWIYRDPSGKTQGPFSGLEMHDWYKAGFFSPELQVKKLEDTEYEPLAQLIRRIGNSREPFLVPQIGIAHGSVVGQSTGGMSASGTIQPPFPGSFPSFGTTLTADQQNALERRKQEEQYLMAQQKEFLQQKQQMMMKNPMQYPSPFNVHPGQLHHHSSAHSLQSQPSYGSMGTPATGYPGVPMPGHQGGIPGGFLEMQRPQPGLGPVGPLHQGMQPSREDELAGGFDRMNISRASPFGSLGPMMQPVMGHDGPSPVNAMLQDRQRLQQEQYEATQRGQVLPQGPGQGNDRLQEFRDLRQDDETAAIGILGKAQDPENEEQDDDVFLQEDETQDEDDNSIPEPAEPEIAERPKPVSVPSKDITEVKPTGPDADVPPPQSVWAAIEKPARAPLEFPAPSASPLPAPAAQRASKPVAETLAAENRSRSQTPSVDTPSSSLAPWAKETSDAPKGPSLKEIQEAEARKAAQQEALAAEQRRQIAEQERVAAAAVVAPAPGLPSSASWANNGSSPVTPGGSAWAKPVAGKSAVSAKKTLAQIQKEEEARKNKAAAAAAAAAASSANTVANPNIVAGKRYSELAGKSATTASPTGPVAGSAWTTVGASGKAKMPIGAPGVTSRTASGSVPTTSAAAALKKPATPIRTNTVQNASQQASEQLMQWARMTLGKGLNAGINVDELVKNLMQFPPEVEIISDTIYSASTTLDGRRLAEEFVRRRKLAEKGIPVVDVNSVAVAAAGSSSNNGGWSEVAKKSAAPVVKEDLSSNFKVVSGKKKGARR